ncbi:MAG: T9SS type A sorting domain-containing protein [Balneolia bacterium]|nr:T9SS type A sorting domain-containing protein [Balneolia bacterium]
MKTPAALFSILIVLSFTLQSWAQSAEYAVDFFPPSQQFTSEWSVRTFDTEDNTLSEYTQVSTEFTELELFTPPDGPTEGIYFIEIYPEIGILEFRSQLDTAVVPLASLIDLSVFDDFDIDLGLEDLLIPVIRTDLGIDDSETFFSEALTIQIPDTLRNSIDLPVGVTLGEDLDLDITMQISRLENFDMDTSYGSFTAAGFKTGLSIDATIYLDVIFIGTIPVSFPLISDYGPEFYFAEGKGLVLEKLDATRISITLQNDIVDIDEELATINGRRVEKTSFDSEPGTSVEALTDLPSGLQIKPNYPNPFNPGTNLQFEIRESASVTIEVFDLTGRKMDVIEAGSFGPGLHAVYYDANRLASGTYFYRITAREAGTGTNAFSASAAFTLIK